MQSPFAQREFWTLSIQQGEIEKVGCVDAACVKQAAASNDNLWSSVGEEEVRRVAGEALVQRWIHLREKRAAERGEYATPRIVAGLNCMICKIVPSACNMYRSYDREMPESDLSSACSPTTPVGRIGGSRKRRSLGLGQTTHLSGVRLVLLLSLQEDVVSKSLHEAKFISFHLRAHIRSRCIII